MKLLVSSVTLREATGGQAKPLSHLRNAIIRAVEKITAEELSDLLARHEADADNLDGTIEANLRKLDPALKIKADCRISAHTNFNSDLVIEGEDRLVCLEIEKGNTSRFELDILKMMVFACRQRATEWSTLRLRRHDLPPEVRSTLQEIKADLERKIGHHIWPE
ncbi:hypothetical protein ACFL09_05965 [Planctomycetota bacterium]